MTDFIRLMHAEWTKLRSLRSSAWTLGAMVVFSIGLAALICHGDASGFASLSAADKATWDPTNESLAGTLFGQLAIGVFGVLAITGEYSSGTIRSSVAAAPRRTPLLAAKAVVHGGVALVIGELISIASFVVGQQIITGFAPHATIGQPGALRSVLLAGVYLALICVLALGAGFLIRHTAGAITAIVALLMVAPAVTAALPGSFQNSVGEFLPVQIGGSSMAATVHVPHSLSPLVGSMVLALYAVVALAAGGWMLARRDI